MANKIAEIIAASYDAKLVRPIKDYAIFLIPASKFTGTLPSSTEWTNPDNLKPVGYNSEDGATLHPEPGDTKEIIAHNGDVARSTTKPGYWTIKFAGIECRKTIAEAYFGVTADDKGAFHVADAATHTEYVLIVVGIDIDDNPIVITAGRAQVSDREDMEFKNDEAITFSLTMKLFKAEDGQQFHLYGLLTRGTTPAGENPSSAPSTESDKSDAANSQKPASATKSTDAGNGKADKATA